MLENSSREQIRQEDDVMEEALNAEEIATDEAITETFHKLVSKLSKKNFNAILQKLKHYAQSHILEPAVAGAIFASMVKGVTAVQPEQTLDYFIPHLCSTIDAILEDQSMNSLEKRKMDIAMQFNLQMLCEVISVRTLCTWSARPTQVLFKHMDKLCSVLDKTLVLDLKDEYELASNALENLLFNIVHIRPCQNYYVACETPVWSKEEFHWAKSYSLDELKVDWYIPGKAEIDVVQNLLDKYLKSQVELLNKWMESKITLEKEQVIRSLRQIYKIIHGCSEILPTIATAGPLKSAISENLKSLEPLQLHFKDGHHIRQTILECMRKVQLHLLDKTPDDNESLNGIVAVYDVILFNFGLNQDELIDHIEEHQSVKLHRNNKLVCSKKHLRNIHIDRICVQHETQMCLKNFLVQETLLEQLQKDIYQLCVSQYSEVRIAAQELLSNIVSQVIPESQDAMVSVIVLYLIHFHPF